MMDLLRANAVFGVCTVQPLVTHADGLVRWLQALLGHRATAFLLRHSFFNQFCGGETREEVWDTRQFLGKYGVKSIVAYSAEADVGAVANPRQLGVDRHAMPARTYDYEGEDECDRNLELCLDSVDTAGPGGVAAVKMTALGKPETLQHVSHVLLHTERTYRSMLPEGACPSTDRVARAAFYDYAAPLGVSADTLGALFDAMDGDKDGMVSLDEWLTYVAPVALGRQEARDVDTLNVLTDESQTKLTEEDLSRFGRMLERAEEIAERAHAVGATVLVDAEQTYLQPAIDHLTLHMQRAFNQDRAVVYNTYQCYLQDTLGRLRVDMHRSHREGFKFGAKLVRGAYMVQEAKRALDLGYDNPVQPSLEATHQAYDDAVALLLADVPHSSVLLATHNADSVAKALDVMARHHIAPSSPHVQFGTLHGMCDHLTYPLGEAGYNAVVYLPYGPVDLVLPYLCVVAAGGGVGLCACVLVCSF